MTPRSPHGERRPTPLPCWPAATHFNPRSPHGERRVYHQQVGAGGAISIHAPRTGSDEKIRSGISGETISIHAPRTGSDMAELYDASTAKISIHAPRTGSDHRGAAQAHSGLHISIHAPRTGSDYFRRNGIRRTHISIHAPRTGSDKAQHPQRSSFWDFNPRSPHGERQYVDLTSDAIIGFQSTLPARGATLFRLFSGDPIAISIHAPRTGSDEQATLRYQYLLISIHAPRTGSDTASSGQGISPRLFQSTLPARGATSPGASGWES